MIDRDNYVLAIFLGNFGLGLLHTAFNFYYVKVFLNIYQVNEYWFNLAQLLFLFWNAINDPLFGYLQDVSGTWMKDRSKIFTYFGPFFVLSFLIPWFPWRSAGSPPYVEGLHLIVSLFFYDAFFSCIGVSWSALYSDSATQDHRKRVKGIKYAQLASLLSVNVIVIIEKASHSLENFAAFQFICISIGIISLACLISTGRLGSSQSASRDPGGKLLDEDNSKSIDESDCRAAEQQSQMTWRGVLVLTKELLSSKNFRCCVFTNFLHICRSTAHMNFAAIATDILVPQSIMAKGSAQLSGFFAVCTLLPQILIITNDKLLLRRGAYRMFMYGCLASICSSALYFFSASPYVVILFMLIDSITVHATSPLFNILLSEVIEEDRARNARGHPLSSLIFSLNALITKPAISIAPVVIVYLLNRNGYEFYQKDQLRSKELQLCMSRVIFATPLLLGALELFVFRKYTLRHKHRMAALPI